MISSTAIVVTAGNSIELSIDWFDTDNVAQTPDAVQYQVFDWRTDESVSEIVDVADLSESMTFLIPASNIPGYANKQRRLVIQIQGTFSPDVHIELFPIVVQNSYQFN